MNINITIDYGDARSITIPEAAFEAPAHLLETAIVAAIWETLDATAEGAKTLIRTPHATGRMYGTHRASAPGEPPAHLTGRLEEAIRVLHEADGGEVYVDEGEAEYAWLLENGSPSGRLAPRPFLRPALDAELPALEERVQAKVEAVTRGG
jgi:hypothetical protein